MNKILRKNFSKLTVISSIALSVPIIGTLVTESTPKRPTGIRTNPRVGNMSSSLSPSMSPDSETPLTNMGPRRARTYKLAMDNPLSEGLPHQTSLLFDKPKGHKPVRTKTYKMAIGNSNGMYGSMNDILEEESSSSKKEGIVNHGAKSLNDLTSSKESVQEASGGTSVVPSKSEGSSSEKGSLWDKAKRFFKK